EQAEVDAIIRQYGYSGTENIMARWRACPDGGDLKDLTHATAHLIHGSTDGRFTVTYAPGNLTENEIRGVNFNYADITTTLRRYDIKNMKNGYNKMPDGEEVYFISTPSAGLWSTEEKLGSRV
ncbi:MAG TPA: hypothetical protein PLK08_08555, partial [Phycisphaerae bacterium]|nr:hypothetical protein [Phycisphaerae bacterium]